jgi:hypothetical protein
VPLDRRKIEDAEMKEARALQDISTFCATPAFFLTLSLNPYSRTTENHSIVK